MLAAFRYSGVVVFTQYLTAALKRAHYEILEGGDGFYASIPGFPGLWAQATTLEDCREELQSTPEGWLLLSLSRQMEIPVVDGIDLAVREVAPPGQSPLLLESWPTGTDRSRAHADWGSGCGELRESRTGAFHQRPGPDNLRASAPDEFRAAHGIQFGTHLVSWSLAGTRLNLPAMCRLERSGFRIKEVRTLSACVLPSILNPRPMRETAISPALIGWPRSCSSCRAPFQRGNSSEYGRPRARARTFSRPVIACRTASLWFSVVW
jgi:predicted RNase H-like HicB family nuclease